MATTARVRISSLASDSLVYGVGQAATKSIYLLLVPILTHAFSTGQYGLTDITNLFVTLVYMVALVGLDSAYAYHYYRMDAADERALLSTTAIAARIGQTVIGSILLILVAPLLSRLLTNSTDHAGLVVLAALTLPGAAGVAAIQDNLRVTFRPAAYAVMTASNVIGNGALTIMKIESCEHRLGK